MQNRFEIEVYVNINKYGSVDGVHLEKVDAFSNKTDNSIVTKRVRTNIVTGESTIVKANEDTDMTALEFITQAGCPLSNSLCIEFMINDSGDGVYYRFNQGSGNIEDEEIFEAPIEYNNEGDSYFSTSVGEVRLDNSLRTRI